jgi:hypothetical protein
MADEWTQAGPIRATARVDTPKYREREAQARLERHQRAALEAGRLMHSASGTGPADHPVWVRAVVRLMTAIGADYATVLIIQGDAGLHGRITRGRGLTDSPGQSRPGAGSPDDGQLPVRVMIDPVSPVPTQVSPPTQPVPGASSSFHFLLYPPASPLPLGCLSLHSRGNLSLTADRVALVHAAADLLATQLAKAGSLESLTR